MTDKKKAATVYFPEGMYNTIEEKAKGKLWSISKYVVWICQNIEITPAATEDVGQAPVTNNRLWEPHFSLLTEILHESSSRESRNYVLQKLQDLKQEVDEQLNR